MKKILALFLLINLCGCTYPEPIKLNTTFDENQAKSLLEGGKLTLTGEAFLRRTDGGVVTCAGQNITLIPATEYALERMGYFYGNSQNGYRSARNFKIYPLTFNPDNTAYHQYTKNISCDAQGHFKFSNINKGKYIILAEVVWGPLPNQYYHEGGVIMSQIDFIENNQHVVLSR